jgi:hypothetical protein
MERNEWSFNQKGSILMLDNVSTMVILRNMY